MKDGQWLMISYTLPREPSRVRVSIWRKLKKIGAVNIQQSLWILPLSEENESVFRGIEKEVEKSGGEAVLFYSSAGDENEKAIIDKFNEARNEEYGELLEQCGDFFKEIEKETERKNFTFAEIEENEEELGKLKNWYHKIEARDAFQANLGSRSKEALFKCKEALDGFCNSVYALNENEEG